MYGNFPPAPPKLSYQATKVLIRPAAKPRSPCRTTGPTRSSTPRSRRPHRRRPHRRRPTPTTHDGADAKGHQKHKIPRAHQIAPSTMLSATAPAATEPPGPAQPPTTLRSGPRRRPAADKATRPGAAPDNARFKTPTAPAANKAPKAGAAPATLRSGLRRRPQQEQSPQGQRRHRRTHRTPHPAGGRTTPPPGEPTRPLGEPLPSRGKLTPPLGESLPSREKPTPPLGKPTLPPTRPGSTGSPGAAHRSTARLPSGTRRSGRTPAADGQRAPTPQFEPAHRLREVQSPPGQHPGRVRKNPSGLRRIGPSLRRLGQATPHQVGNRARHARQRRKRPRLLPQMCADHLGDRRSLPRHRPGQRPVEQQPQPVHIASRPHRPAVQPLRRQIGRRPEHFAVDLIHRPSRGRDPEVDELHPVAEHRSPAPSRTRTRGATSRTARRRTHARTRATSRTARTTRRRARATRRRARAADRTAPSRTRVAGRTAPHPSPNATARRAPDPRPRRGPRRTAARLRGDAGAL